MAGVTQMSVEAGDGEVRLDRWLRRRFPGLNQGRIERLCRRGEIRVNGRRARAATRLEAGNIVRIPPLPRDIAEGRSKSSTVPPASDGEHLRDAVLYRDSHVLAINKPPGLAVQGGTGVRHHVDALVEALRFEAQSPPRLAHRLDKDTSGVLLLGRTPEAAAGLARAFRHRTTFKLYWAAVAGVPQPRSGRIRYGLVKQGGAGREKMCCVHPDRVHAFPGARSAITDYATLEAVAQRASWVALLPVTGRTHQLRAHMAEIGHPIVGDGKYGTNAQSNPGSGWGAQLGGSVSRKLHLHARRLVLDHPVTGKRLEVTAPLPDHMRRTWELFDWSEDDALADVFETRT